MYRICFIEASQEAISENGVIMGDILTKQILKRDRSLFSSDFEMHQEKLSQSLSGSRVLVIGAAGSIGSSVAKQLSDYQLTCLHLVDVSENNLVELVRDLRSSVRPLLSDFKAMPLDLGSLEFRRFLQSEKEYDYVLNLAAMKHVRSEKDPYSLIRMYNTNVLYLKQLLDALENQAVKKLFSVSTDKAVNPVSLMGATKRFMERLLHVYSKTVPCSTARFANVAFSDGSLLYSFQKRFSKRQPLPVPLDIRRYFISHEEAAQLCLLSCICGDNRDVYFPKMEENNDLVSFYDLAELFLSSKGYKAQVFYTEREAKQAASHLRSQSKKWPVYLSKSDTSGEKKNEQFFDANEGVDFDRYHKIGVIHQSETDGDKGVLKAIDEIEKIKEGDKWRKEDILDAIRIAVPELDHLEKNRNLDQKM